MNKGRKNRTPLNTKTNKSFEDNSNTPKVETTKQKLFTPCRRIGLNRKKRTPTPIENVANYPKEKVDNETDLLKINIPQKVDKNDSPDIENENVFFGFTKDDLPNTIKECSVLTVKKDIVLKKKHVTKARKRTLDEDNSSPSKISDDFAANKKSKTESYSIKTVPVSIHLTRCDLDILKLKKKNGSPMFIDTNKAIINTTQNKDEELKKIKKRKDKIKLVNNNNKPISSENEETTIKTVQVEEPDLQTKEKVQKNKIISVNNKQILSDNDDAELSPKHDVESPKLKKHKGILKQINNTNQNKEPSQNDEPEKAAKQDETLKEAESVVQSPVLRKNKAALKSYDDLESPINISQSNDSQIQLNQAEIAEDPIKLKKNNPISNKQILSQDEDSDEMSDFHINVSQRKKKKSVGNKSKKTTPKPSTSTQKETITSTPKSVISPILNSDSDDDFLVKPRRERKSSFGLKSSQSLVKEEDDKKKMKKQKKNDLFNDLNKTDHIRIAENKSYTIIHRENVISYVKSHDNDVTLKITESDDNLQLPSRQFDVSPVKKSMIIERKDYIAENLKTDVENDGTLITSMFDFVKDSIKNKSPSNETSEVSETNAGSTVESESSDSEISESEIKKLRDEILEIENRIKEKKERLESLKRISVYKESHNIKELQDLSAQMKHGLQNALIDLLRYLRQQTEGDFNMESVLGFFKISNDLIGYDTEEQSFL